MYIILGSFLGAFIGSLILILHASALLNKRDSRAALGLDPGVVTFYPSVQACQVILWISLGGTIGTMLEMVLS